MSMLLHSFYVHVLNRLLQVLSHALDRIMLGVFCLLLVATSIFFAMMSNGTCIHDGKIVSISNLGLGDDPDQFQPLDENH